MRKENKMPKKVLIVSSSLRAGSNSELMAKEAERGATEAGNDVEYISLKGKTLNFCKGCLACQKTGKCVIRDDMDDMIDKVKEAEAIIFVTPIYYYELSGQLKTFLDRCNPLYIADNNFRDIYLITTSADDGDGVAEKAVSGLNGWIDCFPKAQFKGNLSGGGINDSGEVSTHKDILEKAFEFGKAI
jgi:multimeric flavodoxin WrbA